MPENGKKLIEGLEYRDYIKRLPPDEKLDFLAITVYEHCDSQKHFPEDISNLKKKVWLNRAMIIGLVALLVALGVIDAKWLHLFGV